ncbi:DUF3489 domain-containing protein [Enhydrobacter sp.]|uniref:DUF3489 domain-containing protein n=1 Tax=Enhydrobacter sp. TaxID=1894999 RepID=UPI002602CB64|nr:DUF3489 domain-containing protein [Enhydrobacter sp.]WIM13028.1 MAG: hypothetical protein OJF58_003994 [Enhydrobacter sp.]
MSKRKKTTTKAPSGRKASKKRLGRVAAGTTKLAQLEALLRRPEGATLDQISTSIGWQAHSVRGAMSATLKKKQGLTISSDKREDGQRVYRIAA